MDKKRLDKAIQTFESVVKALNDDWQLSAGEMEDMDCILETIKEQQAEIDRLKATYKGYDPKFLEAAYRAITEIRERGGDPEKIKDAFQYGAEWQLEQIENQIKRQARSMGISN